nr:MAG TPA: hypothetical protein [Caudoviricetes sp.]
MSLYNSKIRSSTRLDLSESDTKRTAENLKVWRTA